MIQYQYLIFNKTEILIKNLDLPLNKLKEGFSYIPKFLFENVSRIYISNSIDLIKGNLDSRYSNSIIEINSISCKDIKTLLKLLIHELYHANETNIRSIFSNEYKETFKEYIEKRNNVLNKIKNNKFLESPKEEYFTIKDYSIDFDNFLLKTITYPVLYTKIIDVFPSVYSMTSIHEYIATCLEIYYFENKKFLIDYCPKVFILIERINEKG